MEGASKTHRPRAHSEGSARGVHNPCTPRSTGCSSTNSSIFIIDKKPWIPFKIKTLLVGTRTKIYTKEKDPKPHGSSMTPTKNLEGYKTRCGRLEASNARRGQSTSAGNTDETLRSVVTNVPALGWWRWHETAEKCRWKGQIA